MLPEAMKRRYGCPVSMLMCTRRRVHSLRRSERAGWYFRSCRAAIGTPATVSGGYELDAIAAVVIGGANLNGGKASVVNTVIGVLIMALIGNIMNLLSIAAYPQKVVKGVIIIASVLLQSLGRKKQ